MTQPMPSLMLTLYINLIFLVALLGMQPVLRSIDHGLVYALSSLDAEKPNSILQERLYRVKNNQLEFMILLVPIIMAAEFGGAHIAHVGSGASLLIAGRAAYLIFALSGVPFLRSASWLIGFAAWGYLAFPVMFQSGS